MTIFPYNDKEYTVRQSGYDICRLMPDGSCAFVGVNLFQGMTAAEAEAKAKALVKSINPVGVKVVGPDVTRPNMIGGLKIVGPDVTRSNFVYWDKDSVSFPKNS
ncbi:MAG: hypothetical protein P4M13_00275 [Alphaproteobacteria bacterium]|nr:hypothetical protein [Alphaproteobacteria bacterium]